jgi:hypothetical protein
MSLSGSNGETRAFTARHMMESALRRCGIPPSKFTSEMAEVALDQISLMFDEMLNLGIQLWGRDRLILPLYQNRNQVPTPSGTSVVLTVNQRYLSRIDVSDPFSTPDGTAANAFDDDFDTACVQTDPDGTLGAYFSGSTQITTIGILFYQAFAGGVFYEYTTDNTNWTAIDSTDITAQAGEWYWLDLGTNVYATGFRIRTVGDIALAVSELYFGNSPNEIPMGVWNLDDWNSMVTKTTAGAPWNWYQQRDLDTPVLYIWPMPDDTVKYYQLVVWRRRYLDQVTALAQSLDISRRWYEAVTSSLARRLCLELPEADPKRYPMLQAAEAQAVTLAAAEERDPAPIRISLGIDAYTR